MKLWFYGFFMAWGMFLYIPCPFPKWDEAARKHMLSELPLIGLIIGGFWALAAWVLNLISCPAPLSALLMSVLPWAVTGFIHLDGFMDVCDALLSRRDLENKRRILKDPHCGAFAVICMVLLALASWSVFYSNECKIGHPITLLFIPVAVRACASAAVLILRPMETSQYAKSHGKTEPKYFVIPILALAVSVALPIILYGTGGLGPAAAAVGYWLFCMLAYKKLDGMNGDISGFALTLGEFIGAAVLMLVR